jgi:hypothetical protein
MLSCAAVFDSVDICAAAQSIWAAACTAASTLPANLQPPFVHSCSRRACSTSRALSHNATVVSIGTKAPHVLQPPSGALGGMLAPGAERDATCRSGPRADRSHDSMLAAAVGTCYVLIRPGRHQPIVCMLRCMRFHTCRRLSTMHLRAWTLTSPYCFILKAIAGF